MQIVIIPARGGSKGIKRKNLALVGGISLLERAVRSAGSAEVDLVVVSTDDEEIAKVANSLGCVVHKRSKTNSHDSSSSESVILEVIKDLGSQWPDDSQIALVQATSPFIEPVTIKECLAIAAKGKVGFSAASTNRFLWQKENTWNPVGHPADYRPRRQELSEKVVESGAVYAFNKKNFLEKQYRFCADAVPVLVSPYSDIEIFNDYDIELANLLNGRFEIEKTFKITKTTKPRIIFTDFDGCLTDDKVQLDSNNVENVVVNRKDGLAVARLKKLGIDVLIASKERNKVVALRGEKLGIKVMQGLDDKVSAISEYLKYESISWEQVWFVGNDVNDLAAMSRAKLSFCPSDATYEARSIASVVLSRKGGEGVLAEIVSYLERLK
jgi:YrbI family 3-deoxy-D-manno-octulosonate 8-phosphate phosphatase